MSAQSPPFASLHISSITAESSAYCFAARSKNSSAASRLVFGSPSERICQSIIMYISSCSTTETAEATSFQFVLGSAREPFSVSVYIAACTAFPPGGFHRRKRALSDKFRIPRNSMRAHATKLYILAVRIDQLSVRNRELSMLLDTVRRNLPSVAGGQYRSYNRSEAVVPVLYIVPMDARPRTFLLCRKTPRQASQDAITRRGVR